MVILALFSLVLAVLPVLMVQHQQSRVMQLGATSRVDSVLWITYQFEREHSRLRVALRNMMESPSPTARQDLVLRYDIFFSRFELVKTSPSLEYLHKAPEFRAVIEALEAYVKASDPVIAGLSSGAGAGDVNEIRNLLQQANKDEEVLRDLTNYATNTVSKEIDARNATIANQGTWIFVLGVLQWLILSGALIGFILYVRRQRLHNLELTKFTRRLRAVSRKADSANQAKSVFLANMSHELRTPFQGLLGMLNLLSDTSLSQTQQDFTNTAISSARHLLKVLNDIIDISTIETGVFQLRTAPVNLRALVDDVEAIMAATAAEKKLGFHVSVADNLPHWIVADSTRLSQMLFNLLANAIKFTDNGQVSLHVSLAPETQVGGSPHMCFSVQDTGIGMNATTLAGLFSRFYQGDASIQRRFGGTGLGLEISKNLAHMMQGHISVSSKLGEGSVFTLTLPLHAAHAPSSTQLTHSSIQHQLKILVVDDHPVNLKHLSILLQQMGHAIVCCDNGAESLIQLNKQPFDLVLMDLHMPKMDGIQATRSIRQLKGAAAQTKIIIVSADLLNHTRQTAIEAGADDFVAKPLFAEGLRAVLARCVDSAAAPLTAMPLLAHPLASKHASDVITVQIYQEFIDLMPQATVNRQLQTIFGSERSDIKAIEAALLAGNLSEAKRIAHQLRGACLLMGFTHLDHTLGQVEQISLDAPQHPDAEILAQLHWSIDKTHEALTQLSAQSTGTAVPQSELESSL